MGDDLGDDSIKPQPNAIFTDGFESGAPLIKEEPPKAEGFVDLLGTPTLKTPDETSDGKNYEGYTAGTGGDVLKAKQNSFYEKGNKAAGIIAIELDAG